MSRSYCVLYSIHPLYPFNLNLIYKESFQLNSKNLQWIKDANPAKSPHRLFLRGIFLHEVIRPFMVWGADIYMLGLVLDLLSM